MFYSFHHVTPESAHPSSYSYWLGFCRGWRYSLWCSFDMV